MALRFKGVALGFQPLGACLTLGLCLDIPYKMSWTEKSLDQPPQAPAMPRTFFPEKDFLMV